jgi:hypothetical protein
VLASRQEYQVMRLPSVRFTLGRMMVPIALLAALLALHTPVFRDVMRHEALIRNPTFSSHPAWLAHERGLFASHTVPVLVGLETLAFLLGLICWRRCNCIRSLGDAIRLESNPTPLFCFDSMERSECVAGVCPPSACARGLFLPDA